MVLAAMIALRALVPVGYMLSLPGDGSADWALHLCPVQNRSLDVSAFQTAARGKHHDHASKHAAPATADRSHLTVSGDCAMWLDSATPALAASFALPAHAHATASSFNTDLLIGGRLCRLPGQARAPPASV